MLGFLQRYQKVFIGALVAVLCVSFLFFGILPKGGGGLEDPVAYTCTDGKKVRRSKLEGLKALMETNNGETLVFGKALGAHFFTENFIVTDLMRPGLLSLLVERHYDELKDELSEKLEREKKFKPYSHPNANFLTAELVWSLHAPKLKEEYSKLTAAQDPLEAFKLRQDLYLQEEAFDPFALWQVLSNQEAQFSWLPKDPDLVPEKLHLFGYQSTKEWLGERLMDQAAKLVIEVNHFAKSQGCIVSKNDAENDLMKLNETNFQRLKALGIKDFQSADQYYQTKLKALGLTSHQMVELWRDLLMFRRFLDESAQSLVLDNPTLQAFESYAGEKVQVAHYGLPQDLQFEKTEDWMQFEAYLQALGKPVEQLDLKFKQKPIEEIAKAYPYLVEDRLSLAYQEVSLAGCSVQVQQREIWAYKLSKGNITTLKKEFPALALNEKMASKELQAFFESLDSKTNYLVDQWIKEELVKQNESWVERALEKAEVIRADVSVRKNGQGLPFIGLEGHDGKDLWLQQLLSSSDLENHSKYFTFDDQHFYKISEVTILEKNQLVSYSQLKSDRTLEKHLYLTLKEFKKGELKIEKTLTRACQVAAEEWLAPLKRAIRNDYLALHKEPLEFNDEFYTQYRLYAPMRGAQAFVKDHAKLGKGCQFGPLWTIEHQNQMFVRYLDGDDALNALLSLKVGHWTKVTQGTHGFEFSHVLSKSKDTKSYLTQRHLKKKIGNELKRILISNFMDENPTL